MVSEEQINKISFRGQVMATHTFYLGRRWLRKQYAHRVDVRISLPQYVEIQYQIEQASGEELDFDPDMFVYVDRPTFPVGQKVGITFRYKGTLAGSFRNIVGSRDATVVAEPCELENEIVPNSAFITFT